MPQGEAEQKRVMDAWMGWFGKLGPAVVDGGNPCGQARTVSAGGKVANGGGANPASGYIILEADSLDKAVEMAKGCPVLQGGGSIEVAETFNVM